MPYNISSMSGDDIALRQMLDSPELLRAIPGVGVVDRGPRNASVVNGIRIRGLNVDSAALGDYAVSAVSTVSTYVDDTPIFANFLLKDIQRVEVLRGPQGTLYGSGSLGGTVRYVMNRRSSASSSANVGGTLSQRRRLGRHRRVGRPDAQPAGRRHDRAAAQRHLCGLPRHHRLREPLRARRQRHSGRAERRARSGRGIRVEGGHGHGRDRCMGGVAARWEPSETFDATLSFFGQSDDFGGRRQPTPARTDSAIPTATTRTARSSSNPRRATRSSARSS